MKIKQILVPLTGESKATAVADLAFQIAKQSQAHVIGTDTVTDPGPFLDQTGVGMMAGYYDELFKSAEKVQNQKRANAKAAFEEARGKAGVAISAKAQTTPEATAQWLAGEPVNGATVSLYGRLSDLIVLAHPGEKAGYADMQNFETAVFTARRAVVLVPEGCAGLGKRAAIAWNGSIEACGAVEGAIPLLETLDGADIIQVGDIPPGNASAAALADYLGWHGIAAKVHNVADKGERTAKLIENAVKTAGASCLVMGAYTHSPLRELVLGGVTQYMITHGKLPLIMAH
jgi:nucleotide-binding universal stress UspA family protein